MRHDRASIPPAPVAASALSEAVAAAIAALRADEPDGGVDAALAAFHDRLPGGFVSLFLLEHGLLWLAGMRGYAMVPDGLALDEGIVGRTARTGVPQLILDVTRDEDFIPSVEGIVSELAVPIDGRPGVAGVLNIESTAQLPPDTVTLVEPLRRALERPVEELAGKRTLDLSALARLFVYVGSMRDAQAIADLAARSLSRVIPLESSQLALQEDGRGLVDLATWSASDDAPRPLTPHALATLRARVDAAAVFGLLDGAEIGTLGIGGPAPRSVVLVPLRAGGHEIGVLAGTSRFPREYDHRQAEAAALLGAHAAASIDAAVALSRERRSALTDSLTSLPNRRAFDETLEVAVLDARESLSALTVIVLDCDDFKDVNDRAGHEFGDALLREIGAVLAEIVPADGTAARLGGDEFAIVLAGVDADLAADATARLVDDLRSGLAASGFPVRLSAGLATYPYDGAGPAQLTRAADQALYVAKASGKGRVVSFRDVVQAPVADRPDPVAPAPRDDDRRTTDRRALSDLLEACTSLWSATSTAEVLERLARSLPYALGAAGCLVSRVDDGRIQEVADHSLRDVSLGEPVAYLLSEFPVTEEVVRSGRSRAVSFGDPDLDRAEAFVLRELGMRCCLLVPIHVGGEPWGLVEVYDRRHRRFTETEQAAGELLTQTAARRIEALDDAGPRRRLLPLFRLPRGD